MVEEWIALHRQEMLEDIRSLVEIPSVAQGASDSDSPYGTECALATGKMTELAKKYGFTAENCGGHCVKISYGTSGKRVEIWNHLDVVPQGEGWMYPPFACTVKDGFLIGRGVSDNKGPAIAVLYALRYLKEQGVKLHYDLSQICGLSEETGMEDADWYVKQYGSPELALISDCRFPLCYGEKGRCVVKMVSTAELPHIQELSAGIVANSVADKARLVLEGKNGPIAMEVQGIAGHAAAPEKCVNPIGLLAEAVEKREDVELTEAEKDCFRFLKRSCSDGYGEGLGIAVEDTVFGKMTCAGTLLRLNGKDVSKSVAKSTAKSAALEFDLRFPPKTDITKVVKAMDEVARAYGWKVEKAVHTGGYVQNLAQPFVQELLGAYREVYGDVGSPYVMGGNTYGRFFENAVGFGPGIPRSPETDREQAEKLACLDLSAGHGGGHGCDEVQSIEGLCNAIKIYGKALQRLNLIYQ